MGLRVSLQDLSAKTVKELKHLADHLDISVEGCLEKREIVERIASSSRVEVLGNDPCADENIALSTERLRAMNVRQLRAEMDRLGVDTRGCVEKSDMIDRLQGFS